MTAISIINQLAPRKASDGLDRLHDLGLDGIDFASIANTIEVMTGRDIPDAEVEQWAYVSCVERSVKTRLTA